MKDDKPDMPDATSEGPICCGCHQPADRCMCELAKERDMPQEAQKQ